jgi:hypothetical protein
MLSTNTEGYGIIENTNIQSYVLTGNTNTQPVLDTTHDIPDMKKPTRFQMSYLQKLFYVFSEYGLFR